MCSYYHHEEDSGQKWGMFHRHGWFQGGQARRGDMRHIILHVLKKSPMHGYEIMRILEEKSHGMWRPSPGSIYPTLQMLEEQDLVTSAEKDGKKVYSLTETGEKEAQGTSERSPWEFDEQAMKRKMALREIVFESLHILKEVVKNGSDADFEKVKGILTETKDQLSKLRPDQKS